MNYPELRPANVAKDEKAKAVFYDIDQFRWYQEGLDRSDVPSDLTRRSAVQFDLPHSGHLIVAGKGIRECDAYFISRGNLWHVFHYTGDWKKVNGVYNARAIKEAPLQIFTTFVSPFIANEMPDEYLRNYSFFLWGAERFNVTAKIGATSKEDTLSLLFLPDLRDALLCRILDLNCKKGFWDSPSLAA